MLYDAIKALKELDRRHRNLANEGLFDAVLRALAAQLRSEPQPMAGMPPVTTWGYIVNDREYGGACGLPSEALTREEALRHAESALCAYRKLTGIDEQEVLAALARPTPGVESESLKALREAGSRLRRRVELDQWPENGHRHRDGSEPQESCPICAWDAAIHALTLATLRSHLSGRETPRGWTREQVEEIAFAAEQVMRENGWLAESIVESGYKQSQLRQNVLVPIIGKFLGVEPPTSERSGA